MIWTTKDGRKLEPREMETKHIQNCASLLRRRGFVSINDYWDAICCASSLQGEYAQLAAETEIANLKPSQMLSDFEYELDRRRAHGIS